MLPQNRELKATYSYENNAFESDRKSQYRRAISHEGYSTLE